MSKPLETKTSPLIQIIGAIVGTGLVLLIAYFSGCLKRSEKRSELVETEKQLIINKAKENNLIKDAYVTETGVLYLAIADDTQDKAGMASYYCRLARERSIALDAVKVVDVLSFEKGEGWAKGKTIGQASCD